MQIIEVTSTFFGVLVSVAVLDAPTSDGDLGHFGTCVAGCVSKNVRNVDEFAHLLAHQLHEFGKFRG